MGLRINQNIAAMNSYRNLSNTDNQLSKSLEKLSSGFRINRAADDAAGLAISEGLRSQVGGLKVAVRNSQDGIPVVQTAEGALNESHSILQRMRDLSVQASNSGSLNEKATSAIQSEIGQLSEELTRIADTTKFNGKELLNGQYNGAFQVGANVGEKIDVAIAHGTNKGMSAADLGLDTLNVAAAAQAGYVEGLEVGDVTTAEVPATKATATLGAVSETPGDFTGTNATFNFTVDGGGPQAVTLNGNYTTRDALITDLNAKTTGATWSVGTDNKLVVTSDGAAGTTSSVAIDTVVAPGGSGVQALATKTGAAVQPAVTADQAAVDANDAKASGASKAIKAIDTAIENVSTVRADLGALQNRFEHTINNLNVTVENLSASESRIRDADTAQEMMQFTRNQILSQAGTSMLAQANQGSQGVLSLLR